MVSARCGSPLCRATSAARAPGVSGTGSAAPDAFSMSDAWIRSGKSLMRIPGQRFHDAMGCLRLRHGQECGRFRRRAGREHCLRTRTVAAADHRHRGSRAGRSYPCRAQPGVDVGAACQHPPLRPDSGRHIHSEAEVRRIRAHQEPIDDPSGGIQVPRGRSCLGAAGSSAQLIGAREQGLVVQLGGQARIVLQSPVSGFFELGGNAAVRQPAPCQLAGKFAQGTAVRSEPAHEFALQCMHPREWA